MTPGCRTLAFYTMEIELKPAVGKLRIWEAINLLFIRRRKRWKSEIGNRKSSSVELRQTDCVDDDG